MPSDLRAQRERELHEAEWAYRTAHRDTEDRRRARNEAIVAAVQAGLSQAEVARITRVSRGRIGQIMTGGR